MSYVLSISIGPVQGFIAAARKTRDLRAGSDLLRDVVRATVSEIQKSPEATLIFPATERNEQPSDAANVIVAIVHEDPEAVATKSRQAAKKALLDRWGLVQEFLLGKKGLPKDHFDFELAKEQIESFLEFFAGWAPLSGGYTEARKAASAMLAASKSIRWFPPSPTSKSPSPKSSLNPLYESVVRAPKGSGWRISSVVCSRLLLNPYETLDAISLIKRFYFEEGTRRYPTFASTRTVAINDLLSKSKDSEELKRLQSVLSLLDAIDHLDEGTVMFDVRDDIESVLKAHDQEYGQSLRREVRETRRQFLDAHNKGNAPRGYFAVVLADGDSMGECIASLPTPEAHQQFSRLLGTFAQGCEDTVKARYGTHIYAGGDDVLALCPVSTAIDLASDLRSRFAETMQKCPGDQKPSLSVAIAICPVSDDLQSCIQFAHSLEKRKKAVGKNALIVGVRVRSGTDRGFIASWDTEPAEKVKSIMDAYDSNRIPRGLASDVHRLADVLKSIPSPVTPDGTSLAKKEFARLASHKEPTPPDSIYPPDDADTHDLAVLGELLSVGHILTRTGDEA